MILLLTLVALAALAASAGMWSLSKIIAGLVGFYIVLAAAFVVLMRQPSTRLLRIVRSAPRPLLRPFLGLAWIMGDGSVKRGSMAPDFELETSDKQSRVRLSSFRGRKSVVLLFVYRPPDGRTVAQLNQFYRRFGDLAGDQVAFFAVYIGEARNTASSPGGEGRFDVPALVDDVQNTAETAYQGWPNWLFLIDRDGRVAFKGIRARELVELLRGLKGTEF